MFLWYQLLKIILGKCFLHNEKMHNDHGSGKELDQEKMVKLGQ